MKTNLSSICDNDQCRIKLKSNARIMGIIESEYRHLADYKKSHSLLKKHLTEELFNVIKYRVTWFRSTLLDVILSGIENVDSKLGVYAPDANAYKVFYELFDHIIEDYHCNLNHTPIEYGFVDKIINVDIKNNYMVSIKISCNRSLCGFPFNRRLSEEQFEEIETRVSQDLLRLEGDFNGSYYKLDNMKKEMQNKLIKENYLFPNRNDKFLDEAIGYRYWPIGRGAFYNNARNFLVWINIEDHLSIISIENGGDLGACYRRLVTGLRKVGRLVGFLYDERLGYLNLCPTNLGTGMEISVQLRLYKLLKVANRHILDEIAARYHLYIDAACKDNCSNFICTVGFKPKLGMNEFQTVKWMQDAILNIIRTEIHI